MLFTVKYKESDIWKYILDSSGKVAFLNREEIKKYKDNSIFIINKVL